MRRLLNKKQTSERTGYHAEHLMRLAHQQQFPRPIKMGDRPNCAVRWIEDEVDAWIAERMAARSVQTPAGRPADACTYINLEPDLDEV